VPILIKVSFPFKLMLELDSSEDNQVNQKQPAIAVWSMYSHNLNRATFQGLNCLPSRRDKRNFIISRGGFAGLHRYAGMWTGDNASTWEFLKVSVVQVLSLGISGHCIVGADVGGFMPNHLERYADPELLIRWYCAYSMLPWFR
jgi:alpha-glucosidase (family GH31 glycosyl hydrolase)